jgi:hypothetical protein
LLQILSALTDPIFIGSQKRPRLFKRRLVSAQKPLRNRSRLLEASRFHEHTFGFFSCDSKQRSKSVVSSKGGAKPCHSRGHLRANPSLAAEEEGKKTA